MRVLPVSTIVARKWHSTHYSGFGHKALIPALLFYKIKREINVSANR